MFLAIDHALLLMFTHTKLKHIQILRKHSQNLKTLKGPFGYICTLFGVTLDMDKMTLLLCDRKGRVNCFNSRWQNMTKETHALSWNEGSMLWKHVWEWNQISVAMCCGLWTAGFLLICECWSPWMDASAEYTAELLQTVWLDVKFGVAVRSVPKTIIDQTKSLFYIKSALQIPRDWVTRKEI